MARRKPQDQLALFDLGPEPEPEQVGVGAARQPEEVEALGRELPKEIHLGGSTWSFLGWTRLGPLVLADAPGPRGARGLRSTSAPPRRGDRPHALRAGRGRGARRVPRCGARGLPVPGESA